MANIKCSTRKETMMAALDEENPILYIIKLVPLFTLAKFSTHNKFIHGLLITIQFKKHQVILLFITGSGM
jgi:hypothetical protein